MNLLIIFVAQYLYLVSIVIFLFFIIKIVRKSQKDILTLSIVSFPLSFIIAKVFSHFIYNPRPFVIEHIKPLVAHAADNGFPSDHMLLTMTIASIVFVYNRKLGIILALIAIAVGIARVLAQIHHIEDIAGSSLIAIVATYLSYYLIHYLSHRKVKTIS